MQQLKLKYDIKFNDLLSSSGVQQLDGEFLSHLHTIEPALCQRLIAYRQDTQALAAPQLSLFLVELAPLLESFLFELFGITPQAQTLRNRLAQESVVQKFKKHFVLRRARRYRQTIESSFAQLNNWLDALLLHSKLDQGDREAAVAQMAMLWLDDEQAHAAKIESLVQWCVLALKDAQGRKVTATWASFKLPQSVDLQQRVQFEAVPGDTLQRKQCSTQRLRQRDGFKLSDTRAPLRVCEDQIHYCIYCHDHSGDFCSKGFPEKKTKPKLGFKRDVFGDPLLGCPLEEKISEMHWLRSQGLTLAALAVAMVDNPMLPATGHRICNDCMKACIYQKQDPVDIPQTETRILTDVLALPWGVEIYDLLTRWNPLRQSQYCMQDYNGHNVLIVGMGPAGFTMAHHLTMAGCAVVGIDGLKIEPIPQSWLSQPIECFENICEPLDERILMGFGGVAEYGITVRWDKNFLKLIYLTLARRTNFQVFGGVRFGGTLTIEDAWQLGFEHICIASGAGYPRVLDIKNGLARGIRQASDFLMALQLTGAAKSSSLANLQIRLPAIVVGSGLTAIDTATEVQAYYIKQVEKVYRRYHSLCETQAESSILKPLDEEAQLILQEYLAHGRAVVEERNKAHSENREADLVSLLRLWGGVTVVYRRQMSDSPAYRRNFHELDKALEEGIFYLDEAEPSEACLDKFGHVEYLLCNKTSAAAQTPPLVLPARAVLVATGTIPNTIYEKEHPGHLQIKGNHFRPYVNLPSLQPAPAAAHNKDRDFGPFTSYQMQQRRISFIGDAHPVFNGSVVKAIASAMRSYAHILTALQHSQTTTQSKQQLAAFQANLSAVLVPVIDSIHCDGKLIELWVKAPMAARKFQAGQFFRLQTYESNSPVVRDTRLQIPLQTISGAGIKQDKVRLLLLRMGANARIAERFKVGDPLVLMGPAGAAAHIPQNKNYLMIAGSWGAAVMLNLGPALRANGNRVLYLAAYRSKEEVFLKQELEASADQMLWMSARHPSISIDRAQDQSFVEFDVVKLLQDYAAVTPANGIPLSAVSEVWVMGSTGLLQYLQSAFKSELKALFPENVHVIGTVGSPMQCMLKGVCAQCLQWQIDPTTGKRSHVVFSCAQQDQELACIDLENLSARQKQNRLSEYLTGLWVEKLMAKES